MSWIFNGLFDSAVFPELNQKYQHLRKMVLPGMAIFHPLEG